MALYKSLNDDDDDDKHSMKTSLASSVADASIQRIWQRSVSTRQPANNISNRSSLQNLKWTVHQSPAALILSIMTVRIWNSSTYKHTNIQRRAAAQPPSFEWSSYKRHDTEISGWPNPPPPPLTLPGLPLLRNRPPHIQLEGLGSAVCSHSGVWGTAPAEGEFGSFYS